MVEAWVPIQVIANHLGVSRPTLFRWIEKGRIPAHKVGNQWRFKISEVDCWVIDGGAAVQNPGSSRPFSKEIQTETESLKGNL